MRGSNREGCGGVREAGHVRAKDICDLVRDNFQKAFGRDLEVGPKFLRGNRLGKGCTRLWALANVIVNPNEVRTSLRLSTLGAGLPATFEPVGAAHVAADVPASRQV